MGRRKCEAETAFRNAWVDTTRPTPVVSSLRNSPDDQTITTSLKPSRQQGVPFIPGGKSFASNSLGDPGPPAFDRDSVISVTFGNPKFTPVRSVVSRSRMCPTGKYPSWKMGRMMEWESNSEQIAFRLLDCDPSIRRYVEQPCEIVYTMRGETRRHYPDIYVESQYEKQLWEVKDDSRALQPDLVTRTKLLTEGLKTHGFTYRLVLASELRVQPRLQNADILLRYGRSPIDEFTKESIRVALRRTGVLTWVGASSGKYGSDGRQALCRLVLEGVIAIDMAQPIGANTQFRSADGAW
jgi:hypothetical protein